MDNAGCYHSQQSLQALFAMKDSIEGLTIRGVYFNEPGKKSVEITDIFENN